MVKIVSVETLRHIETAADAAGFPLDLMMENAGTAVARRVVDILKQLPDPADSRVTVLVGNGKNGGDGLVAARVLAQNSPAQVRAYLIAKRPDDDPLLQAAREAHVFVADAEDDQRFRVLTNMIASANVVVDALFGIGVQLPLRDDAAKLLRAARAAINGSEHEDENLEGELIDPTDPTTAAKRTRPYVLAVDCPSGLNCDTGEIDKNTLEADETVTFIAVKPGLLAFPGAQAVGKLTAATLGIPDNTEGLKDAKRFLVDATYARDLLPSRTSASHKGSYGKALIVGGSINYTGAPGMSALAAYRSGTGLVTVGTPAPVAAILASRLFEPTWTLLPSDMGVIASSAAPMVRAEAAKVDALLIGPGINREKTTKEMMLDLFHSKAKAAKGAIGFVSVKGSEAPKEEAPLPPLALDADALNLLSEIDDWWTLLPPQTIITPHAGEFGRLAKLEREEVEKNLLRAAAVLLE
ncbi:MAG: NAD(P)H-hydrate epimerase [Anaerolineae bacterium]